MSVTPDFIGQVYKKTVNGDIWRAQSLTPGDWTLELQNAEARWVPSSLAILSHTYFKMPNGVTGMTEFALDIETSLGIYFADFNELTSLQFANLTSIDLADSQSFDNIILNCHALTNINLQNLQYSSGAFTVASCDLLTSLDLHSLVTVKYGNIAISNNPLLTSINLSALVPENGQQIEFLNDAVNAATVNQLLARCVANAGFVTGSISTLGASNSAPTGQGLTDKATLIGRGVTVLTQ